MSMNYAAFAAAAPKKLVTAYRHSCEVRGYDEKKGFDEQKAAPAKRGLFGKGCLIATAVIFGLIGVIAVLVAIVFFATGTNGGTNPVNPLIGGLIFCGIAFMLVRAVRSMTTYATWVVRYRLSSFARANGMTYAFRSDPSLFPGITPNDPVYRYLDTVELSNVLRASDLVPVALGYQKVWYRRYETGYSRRNYISGNWNFVAINFGSKSPWLHLTHHRQQDASDPLRSRFRFADGTVPEQAYAFFSPELVTAIVQLPDGYDVMVHNGWLYLLKSSLYDESTGAAGIEERFQIAERLTPLVAELGRG